MMRSGNPALTANTFTAMAHAASSQYAMTIQGTVNKTAILLVLAILTASCTWNMYLTSANPGTVTPWMLGGVIGGFVVVIAALNLVLDFDFIEKGAEVGAPKYMEWYGAFGLVVTLIWLYLEILRLLAKLNSRR